MGALPIKHSAIPKKIQPKKNHQTLHASRKPNIKLIKTKKKKTWVLVMFKSKHKEEKTIEEKIN